MMPRTEHPIHDAIAAIGRAVAHLAADLAERRGEVATTDRTAVRSKQPTGDGQGLSAGEQQ